MNQIKIPEYLKTPQCLSLNEQVHIVKQDVQAEWRVTLCDRVTNGGRLIPQVPFQALCPDCQRRIKTLQAQQSAPPSNQPKPFLVYLPESC